MSLDSNCEAMVGCDNVIVRTKVLTKSQIGPRLNKMSLIDTMN